jgi:hypothetical protein
VKVLSVHKSCAMERVLVGVRINNADTNETWKPRHDHGTSSKLWNISFFLSFFLSWVLCERGEVDLEGTALLCIAPATTMRCELAPSFYESHLSYQAIDPTYR